MASFEPNQSAVITNLVAGISNGGWSSRAGVVINPSPHGLISTQNINATSNNTLKSNVNHAFNNRYTGKNNNAQNILLSPQHFISNTNASQDLDISVDGNAVVENGDVNTNMANLDLSTSNFTKVINFDTLMEQSDGLKNVDPDDNFEEQSLASDLSGDQVDGQLEDPKEQSQLMERYQQLRHWQAQQQEMLMRQQQQQLEALRGEQERVQKMIEKQREVQWGNESAGFPLQQFQENVQHLPPKSPKKSPQRKDQTGNVPNPITKGPFLMTKPQQKISQSSVQQPVPASNHYSLPNRPVPNIPSLPSTPSEYRAYGNPNLDSDTASICTTNKDLEEAFQPLADTASEGSEMPYNHAQQPKSPHSSKEKQLGQGDAMPPTQFSHLLTKSGAGDGGFPRKILTFDETDTDSQPDVGAMQDVRFHPQLSSQNPALIQPSQAMPQSQVQDQLPPGFVNLLSMPAMLQTLPEGMLQQLIALQQQGQTVVVDGNGQMAIYQNPLQNHAANHPVTNNNHPYKPEVKLNDPQLQNNVIYNAKKNGINYSGHHQPEIVTHSNQMTTLQKNNAVENIYPNASQHSQNTENAVLDLRDNKQVVDDPTDVHYQSDNDSQSLENESFDNRGIENTNEVAKEHRNHNGEVHSDFEEEENNEEDENDVESDSDEEEEGNQDTLCIDDQPVGGIGARKKTFEELLEEELRREQERLNEERTPEPTNPVSSQPGKRHFLKKGQGLARFSGQSKPPTTKPSATKKSSQGSGLSNSRGTVSSNAATHRKGTSSSSAGKKQETNRKTAPLKSKTPQEKLKLKPSPKKPPVKKTVTNKSSSMNNKTAQKGELQNKTKSLKLKLNEKSGTMKKEHETKSKEDEEKIDMRDESVISAGEVSFQNRLTAIAQNEEVDLEELQEFEILEKFADDNVSFLSNVSAVNRNLNQKKTHPKYASNGPNKRTLADVQDDEDETLADDISSEEEDGAANTTLVEVKHSPVRHAEEKEKENHSSETVSKNPILTKLQSLKTIHRKIVTKDNRTKKLPDLDSSQHLSKVQQFSDSDNESENKSNSQKSSKVNRMENANVKNHRTSVKTNQNQNTIHSESSDSESESEHSDEEITNHGNNSSKYNSKSGISGSKSHNKLLDYENDRSTDDEDSDGEGFGDEEAWEDESKDADDWEAQFMKSKSKKNSAIVKSKVLNGDEVESQDVEAKNGSETPPTSKLMTKLFPKLKQEKPKINLEQELKLQQSKQVDIGDGVQAKLLQDKLVELENEIQRFRAENAMLEKLRKEREEGLEHLKKEMSEFQKQKDDELKRIQEYKTEETRKLKREKKVFEDYQKTMRTMPNKKEREEIEMLKQQVSDLQDEMKRKEQRWTSSTTRLRDRIEQLEQENVELRDEVKVLEKRRLEAWQQREGNRSSGSTKSKSDTLTSATETSSLTSTAPTGSQLKKSVSGPQLSARAAPQMITKLPQPQKQLAAKPTLQRDHDLRLSTTAEIMKISSETMSEGSEVIHPEDSASNVLSRLSRESNPHQPRTSLLKSSQESSKSDEANNNSRKSTTRKKAVALSISNAVEKGDGQYEEIQHTDGKVERIYTNGAREILFSNGTRKQVSADGQSIIVSFFNGDIKQILPDQRVVYYYSDAQTSHTTYPDGLEILQFPNQQVEKHYPDGTKEITFPDQTVKYLFPNGIEESIFHDGTVIRVEKNGDKTMEFPNGQREIHTGQYKRREYPDGTVKTVYPDGRQETRYSSGRIRVKDKDGTVIVDKRV